MLENHQRPRNSVFRQTDILIEIETFVNNTMTWKGLYNPEWDSYTRQRYRHALLEALPRMMTFYRHDHVYSEHIMAFWNACEKCDLLSCGQATLMLNDVINGRVDGTAVLKDLADLVLDFTFTKEFRRQQADRDYQQQEKRRRLDKYTLSCLDRFSRTLHLRVDLGYRSEANVEIATVYAHLDELLGLIRSRDGFFENLVGYAICLEQGKTKGYHLHVGLFLPGHLHQRDGYLAKELGALWVEITRGTGVYHSCNADKDHFERMGRRGVGMFHRDDELGRDNVVRTLGYLADPDKDDQFLRMRPEGRRAYFTGI